MQPNTPPEPRHEPGEAPFARGDRVIYRPRPVGVETVESVEYRKEGWGGWYVRTVRQAGPTTTSAHRYDRAELYEPVMTGSPVVLAQGGILRRLWRRLRHGRVVVRELAPAEREAAIAGWPPVERHDCTRRDQATGGGR